MRKIFLILMLIPMVAFAGKWKQFSTSWDDDISGYRLSVPHGWIVATKIGTGTAMVFYPDEKHEWKVEV